MILLLRVMFNQGALWRERFPKIFEEPTSAPIVWWCIGAAVMVVIFGVVQIAISSLTVGILAVVCGALWLFGQGSHAAIHRWPDYAERLTSANWVGYSLFALGLLSLLVVSLVLGQWIAAAYAIVLQALFGTAAIRQIEVRYLYFMDPTENESLLGDLDSGRTGLGRWVEPQIDAYVRFPLAISRSVRGGT